MNSFRGGGHSLSSLARTRDPEAEGRLAGVRRRGPRSPALPSHSPRPLRLRGADPGPGRFVPPRARSRRRPTKLPLCPAASAGPDDVSLRDRPGGAQHGLLRPLAAEGGRARLGAPPNRGGPFTEPFPQAQRAADPYVQVPCLELGAHPTGTPALSSAAPSSSNARAFPIASWKALH